MEQTSAKQYFWVILDVTLIALAVVLVAGVLPAVHSFGNSFAGQRMLTVSGEGKATVTPDTALTSFSVVSHGQNPKELTQNNDDKIAAAVQAVKGQGVEAKDIQTTGYDLTPDYRYDQQTERRYITGYTLTQTVNVKIRDISKVASILGALTPLGVNQIGGVSFTIDDQEKVLRDARKDAFEKASKKAEEMAAASGVSLGKILNVSEYGGPIPYYGYGKGGGMMFESAAPSPMSAPTIEPGSQEVRVNVSLTYALN